MMKQCTSIPRIHTKQVRYVIVTQASAYAEIDVSRLHTVQCIFQEFSLDLYSFHCMWKPQKHKYVTLGYIHKGSITDRKMILRICVNMKKANTDLNSQGLSKLHWEWGQYLPKGTLCCAPWTLKSISLQGHIKIAGQRDNATCIYEWCQSYNS